MGKYAQKMLFSLKGLFFMGVFLAPQRLRSEPRQLESIVLTGTQSEHESWLSPVPTESFSVDPKGPPRKLADFLSREAGLELAPGIRGQTLRLQGLDGKYVLILRDGQRISGKVGDRLDLEAIDLSGIERVELIRGASSALYGSEAMGGVINLISKHNKPGRPAPYEPSWEAKLSQSSDQRSEVAVGGELGGAIVRHKLSLQLRSAAPEQQSGSEATRFSGRRSLEVYTRQTWWTGETFSLLSELGAAQETFNGTDVSGAGAVWDRNNEIQRLRFGLSPSWRLSPTSELRLQSQLQVHDDQYASELRVRPEERSEERSKETLAQHTVTLQQALGLDHLLTLGAELLHEKLHSDRLSPKEVKRERLALFAQDEYSFSENLLLVPGLRIEDDSQFAEQTLAKLALRYALGSDTILRPAYAQAYRAPSFKELYLRFENPSAGYIVTGSEDLKPERSEQWQFNLDHRFSESAQASFSLFQHQIRDLIDTVAEEGLSVLSYRYQNRASVRTRGLDSSWKQRWALVHLQLSHHYLEARDRELKRELEARPRQRLSYRLSQIPLSERLRLAHEASFSGPAFVYDSTGRAERSQSIYYAHAALDYTLDESWRASFHIENLTNAAEEKILAARPRSFLIGISWNHTNKEEEIHP